MGGSGSGNFYHWWRPSKKTTTDDCLSLDAGRWTREGILKAGTRTSGTWRWTYHSGASFAVHYEADLAAGELPRVRLWYAFTYGGESEVHRADYGVRLTSTRPCFGGLRWWFLCPLAPSGRPCGRRVGKLFLPPRERYFGCRHCHSLTYRSCQESRKLDGLARLLAPDFGEDPATVKRLLGRIGKRPR